MIEMAKILPTVDRLTYIPAAPILPLLRHTETWLCLRIRIGLQSPETATQQHIDLDLGLPILLMAEQMRTEYLQMSIFVRGKWYLSRRIPMD
jgi:hypothetical protein